MTSTNNKYSSLTWVHLLFAIGIIVTYFLPWVSWDSNLVKGSDMAAGNFFSISNSKFGLANPFPQFSFAFYTFWLIPVLAFVTVILIYLKKKTITVAYFAGALSLALVSIYYLFTKILIDLGAGENVFSMLKPASYLHAFCAVGLIVTALPVKNNLYKLLWIIIGPVLAYGGFKIGEEYVLGETHQATENVKVDYTLNATDLIKEFTSGDTAVNNKYREKVIVLNGQPSAIDFLPDSTSTIKFADSTKSYAIFSFEKNEYEKVKAIKPGNQVSLKGICSGGIFSEILGTTVITFKRTTFNK